MYQFEEDKNKFLSRIFRLNCKGLTFKIDNWPHPLQKRCSVIKLACLPEEIDTCRIYIFTGQHDFFNVKTYKKFQIENIEDVDKFISDVNRQIEQQIVDLYKVGSEKYIEARQEFN